MTFTSKLSTALAAIIIAACMLSGATAARADVITFTLENVTFSDGGTATGTLTFDTTSLIGTPDITTTTDDNFIFRRNVPDPSRRQCRLEPGRNNFSI